MTKIEKFKNRIQTIIECEEVCRESLTSSLSKAFKDCFVGGLLRALKELEEIENENSIFPTDGKSANHDSSTT